MTPRILFISEHAIRKRGFVQAFFVQAAKLEGKTLLFHETGVSDPAVNWYVSKKISSGLSEQMIPNNALPVSQTKHLALQEDTVALDTERIAQQLQNVYLLVMNAVSMQDDAEVVLDTPTWLKAIRRAYPDTVMQFFPDNPDSAIGMDQPMINTPEDAQRLLEAFPEERRILELAAAVAPSQIVLATNFAL